MKTMERKTARSAEAPAERGRVRAVPICHYQMEYAAWVRREFDRFRPDAVAVELPSTLRPWILTAVKRLPYLSVILYEDGRGETVYLPIEPCDAVCEAVRTALERQLPVHLVDMDTDSYPLHFEPMPDPVTVHRLGLAPVFRAYRDIAWRPPAPASVDGRREQHMAYGLQRLAAEHERVLFVAGMAHVPGVLDRLDEALVRPAGPVRRAGVRVFDLHPESAREVMGEIPFVSAVYERWRQGIEPPDGEEDEADFALPGTVALHAVPEAVVRAPGGKPAAATDAELIERRLREVLRSLLGMRGGTAAMDLRLARPGGRDRETGAPQSESKEPETPSEEPALSSPEARPALRLLGGTREDLSKDLAGRARRGAGADGSEPVRPEGDPASPASVRWETYDRVLPATGDPERPWGPDRERALLRMLERAAKPYERSSGQTVQRWQRRNTFQFLRAYASLEGRLLPDFYQLLVGARSCVGDEYAHEVWELGSAYPFVDSSGKLERLQVRGEEVWLGTRRIRFRRRLPDRNRRQERWPVKRRKRERRSGEWAERFRLAGLCSYPPEDIVIEKFGEHLRKRAGQMLSEEHSRVERFTTSLLDGLDMRETLRNWHDGHRLYVREARRIQGDVGAVVIVFDEDRQGTRYPWTMTWWGEHEQESDLAFYATEAVGNVVGPGISRCRYGGFLLSYPPGRVFDVWIDPTYQAAETKPERLLMAAVDYSLERHVVYVAARPPRSRIVSWASAMDKKVLYLPIGSLSPPTLDKLRTFHVLSDHAVRDVAPDYIG